MTKTVRLTRPLSLRDLARRRRQTGELSMIEAAAVMAGAALLALLAYAGGHFVMDRIHASQFKNEAQLFHTGVLDATANDTDFSAETLTTLAQNHAFEAAGGRVATGNTGVTGLFGGAVTAAPGTIETANDAMIVTYPVPATVCSLSVAALANAYTMVTVNGTTIYSPSTAFNSSTAGAACTSAGTTASIGMYTTRS
ncbi:type 4 pilus major pilin [Paraburkholderia phenazinium]|uniref:type 4 pilus major pilin n=1 Tax=Paraburkholderia phenazinium TaxID=60549 RepID=UPI00158E68F9|nr:type 4 pilus major pilin [Paraburkholderia phenazinium]